MLENDEVSKAQVVPKMSLETIIAARGLDVKTVSRLANIEPDGDRLDFEKLSASQRSSLADVLGIDVTLLESGVSAELLRIPVDFRTERNDNVLITKSLLNSIYRAYEIVEFISTLKPYTNLKFDTWFDDLKTGNENLKEIKRSLRAIFNGDGSDFSKFDSPYKLFLNLRYRLEKSGVIVICERSKDHAFKGFCAHVNKENLVYINIEKQNYESRIFTLIHETVHLILNEPGIVNPLLPRLGIERFCNRVTSEFLLPSAYFKDLFPYLAAQGRNIGIVNDLAKKFPYSKYFLAIRAEEVFPNLKGLTSDWLNSVGIKYRSRNQYQATILSEGIDAEDDADIEESDYMPHHTSASYQVARLGFSVLSFAETLQHASIVNRYDLSSYLKIPARDQEKIFSSMRRKQQEAAGYGSI